MLCDFFPDIRYVMIINYKEMKTFLIIMIITIFIVKNYSLFNHLLKLIIINLKLVIHIR